jgi:hypothetical protein
VGQRLVDNLSTSHDSYAITVLIVEVGRIVDRLRILSGQQISWARPPGGVSQIDILPVIGEQMALDSFEQRGFGVRAVRNKTVGHGYARAHTCRFRQVAL